MKKKITTLFMFAATMFVALTFTACGEEAVIGSDDNEPKGPTEFFTGNGKNIGVETRTSIDKDRYFYWTVNDKIWVEQTPGNWIQSLTNTITAKQPTAKFYFNEPLPNETYNVRYTGLGNTSAESVIVRATQTQSAWDNGDHIATSGDCGIAEAEHQGDRKYKFSLLHKAAYIILYPYMVSSIPSKYSLDRTYTLMKVEVKSTGGAEIAGTFNFTGDGITGAATENASDMITLNCSTNGFPLENNANPSKNHLFIVLRPVELNRLTFIYYIKDNTDGTVFAYDVSPGIRTYSPNGVTVLTHAIRDLVFKPTFYKWGSSGPYTPSGVYSTWVAPNQLNSGAWQYAPNVNEMLWYAKRGSLMCDLSTPWRIQGMSQVVRVGHWVRKKANITGFSATEDPDGIDRTQLENMLPLVDLYTATVPIGQPHSGIVDEFFYLPGFGYYGQGDQQYHSNGVPYYWSKSPASTNTVAFRWGGSTSFNIVQHPRNSGFVVGQGWFQ